MMEPDYPFLTSGGFLKDVNDGESVSYDRNTEPYRIGPGEAGPDEARLDEDNTNNFAQDLLRQLLTTGGSYGDTAHKKSIHIGESLEKLNNSLKEINAENEKEAVSTDPIDSMRTEMDEI